ncbi:MAG TPA: phosphatase PAP2 family protein [Candidatus Saccharimonadales bacterium]|nr:phosphatase PAP2 family protein [Candidatus Saccharimonadales bacterium]
MGRKIKNIFDFTRSSGTTKILTLEIALGGLITFSTLLLFAKIADRILDRDTIALDNTIIQVIYSLRNPALTAAMKIITFFGGEIFLAAAILTTILIIIRKHKGDAFIFSFILFSGVVLNIFLKDVFQRPRPDLSPLIHESSYSFPSGHSINSFIFYTALSYFIFRKVKNKKLSYLLIAASTILILLIGLSRVYLGVHYPSDVVAGYAEGVIWFASILVFEKALIFFRLMRQYETQKSYDINLES